MKLFYLLVLLCHGTISTNAQKWHKKDDSLIAPQTFEGMHTSVFYSSRFDTVKCFYMVMGSYEIKKGFKYVYVSDGFYVDVTSTVNVFFDDQRRRIFNVEKYYFK